MRWEVVLLLGAAYSFCQVQAKLPHKEDLCGMIVDSWVEQQCLECFTQAGHISKHPEKVRKCTATYLPPDLADCSVPHAENTDTVRIHQGGGEYHSNHTNANFLPTCLRRRLRNLKDYQKQEERFVSQASGGVKYIVESTLVEHGGPTMLSIHAMASIIQLPDIKNLVEKSASHCQDKYRSERLQQWERDLWEDTDEYKFVLADLMEEEEEMINDKIEDDDVEEDSELMKSSMRAPAGNNLPFGGTNRLARRVMMYKCIISSLFDSGAGPKLLKAVMKDDFFSPVPEWLVKPLLVIAKNATE